MATITQDKFDAVKQQFHHLFNVSEQHLNGHKNHPLFGLRKEAIQQLQDLRFPTRRDEDWKYTALTRVFAPEYKEGSLVQVAKEELSPFLFTEEQAHTLVFVNGQYDAGLSQTEGLPENVSLMSIDEALLDERFANQVREQITSWQNDAGKTLVTLNTSFAHSGFFLNVPANTVVDRPIHFLYLQKNLDHAQMYHPQHLVIAGTSSQFNVIETYHQLNADAEEPIYSNPANRFLVGANAQVGHYKVQDVDKNSFQTFNTDVIQQKDSTYSSYVADLGGRLVRNNLSVWLKGQNTHTDMYGLYLGDEQQHIDTQTFIDHAIPHCDSNELYKGILTDKAVGVFNGKVMVRQDAQKTNAFQQSSSLVLSESAKMNSKPQLEIFADDVRCSHGATIGQLEEGPLYYLRTRGLSKEKASSLLQLAFLAEVIESFKLDGVQKMTQQLVERKLA
jgi:Fe-S cluster assembly protein SufD